MTHKLLIAVMLLILLVLLVAELCRAELVDKFSESWTDSIKVDGIKDSIPVLYIPGLPKRFTQADREFNTWVVLFVGIVVVIFALCGMAIIGKWLSGVVDEKQ